MKRRHQADLIGGDQVRGRNIGMGSAVLRKVWVRISRTWSPMETVITAGQRLSLTAGWCELTFARAGTGHLERRTAGLLLILVGSLIPSALVLPQPDLPRAC